MSTCNHCGGAIFPVGAVIGYAGPICGCHRPLVPVHYPGGVVYGPVVFPPRSSEEEDRAKRAKWDKLIGEMQKNPPKVEIAPTPAPVQGWQCPICKTVHAPFVRSCPQSHPK